MVHQYSVCRGLDGGIQKARTGGYPTDNVINLLTASYLLCVIIGAALGIGLYRTVPALSPLFVSNGQTQDNQQQQTRMRYSTHSYHDGIMKVAPSVVSLYSSETIYKAPVQRFHGSEKEPTIAPRERRSTSQGSGVIIDADGLVLTNWHLIEDADEINVVLSNGSLHQATVIGKDSETDLAVVSINASGLPAVEIESNIGLRVGDIVLAIGNPFGVGQTVTQGIVSATARRVAGASAWQNFVQVDAAINPGNSGGALISPDGELLGINTAVFLRDNGAEGIGFAIPTERQVDKGAVITAVLEASPADVSGLRPYDVVVAAADQPIANATELLLLISGMAPGTQVPLAVLRDNQSLEISAQLLERPNFDQ